MSLGLRKATLSGGINMRSPSVTQSHETHTRTHTHTLTQTPLEIGCGNLWVETCVLVGGVMITQGTNQVLAISNHRIFPQIRGYVYVTMGGATQASSNQR